MLGLQTANTTAWTGRRFAISDDDANTRRYETKSTPPAQRSAARAAQQLRGTSHWAPESRLWRRKSFAKDWPEKALICWQ